MPSNPNQRFQASEQGNYTLSDLRAITPDKRVIERVEKNIARLEKEFATDSARMFSEIEKVIQKEIEIATGESLRERETAINKEIQRRRKFAEDELAFSKKTSAEKINTILEQTKQIEREKKLINDDLSIINDKIAVLKALSDSGKISPEQKIELEALTKTQAELEKQKQDNLEDENKLSSRREKLSRQEEKALRRAEKRQKQKEEYEGNEPAEDGSVRARLGFKARVTLFDPENPLGKALDDIDAAISSGLKSMAKATEKAFANAETVINDLQAKVSTRLEGSGRDYKNVTEQLRKSLALSSIVSQKAVLENLAELVKSGTAYNVEQRAFLKTIAEDIDSTFEAFNKDLLRIVRLQREDSTFARMGLETHLQRVFNEYYLDSSYLTDQFDNVTGALIDATSQMSAAQSAEFEFIVQKWLGALYSAGASSNFISQLASGLNLLGTGGAQQLTGPMATLLAYSTSRSKGEGMDYASLLTGGLTADTTNELLRSMVEYLAELAENSATNKVTANALGNTFGFSLSDLRAVTTVSEDINKIYNETLKYAEMANVTESRLATIGENYTLSKRASTLFENLMFSTFSSIVESPAGYLGYKAADMVDKLGGGVRLNLKLFGSGVDFTLADIAKDAIMGIGLVSTVLGNLGSLDVDSSGPKSELSRWLNPGQMRGNAHRLTLRESQSVSYAGNADAQAAEDKMFKDAGDVNKKVKNAQEEQKTDDDISMEDLYYGFFKAKNRDGHLTTLSTVATDIHTLLLSQAAENAQRVVISGFDFGDKAYEIPIKFGPSGKTDMNKWKEESIANRNENIGLVIQLLAGMLAENDALNVNLKSSDVPITDMVVGNKSSTDEATMPERSSIAPIVNSVMNGSTNNKGRDNYMM